MLMACVLSGGRVFSVIVSVAFHVNETYSSSVRIEVFTVVLLKIQVLSDVMLR
jgi:hypothetical protein